MTQQRDALQQEPFSKTNIVKRSEVLKSLSVVELSFFKELDPTPGPNRRCSMAMFFSIVPAPYCRRQNGSNSASMRVQVGSPKSLF